MRKDTRYQERKSMFGKLNKKKNRKKYRSEKFVEEFTQNPKIKRTVVVVFFLKHGIKIFVFVCVFRESRGLRKFPHTPERKNKMFV